MKKKAKKKKWKYLLLCLLIIMVIGTGIVVFTDVYKEFGEFLACGVDIDKNYGDTILVLGGGLRKGAEIGYSTEERLLLAAVLFRQKTRHIIISDGSLYPRSPAIKKMTKFLEENGVPKEYIHMEGKSQTTFDNFFYTRNILEEVNAKEVIVCTSPYHQKRAEIMMNYFKIKNFEIAKMNCSEVYHSDDIPQRLRNFWLIVREYMAILKFKIFKR